jgi:ABC-type Na+ transport system ATPase subunit NatA
VAQRAQPDLPLRLNGVSRTFRGRPAPVLEAVDLELAPGSLTWLSGHNGAGKTTLLRVIGGLLDPDRGQVLVCGRDLQREPRACKRELGFLAAGSSGLYARLTARQQLAFTARINFVEPARVGARVEAAIERFQLRELAGRRLDRMSMGERQRVRLAMAFLHEPRVVLLDEPRTSLDTTGLEALQDAVAGLRAAGGAVLWCSPSGDRPGIPCDAELALAGGRLERR